MFIHIIGKRPKKTVADEEAFVTCCCRRRNWCSDLITAVARGYQCNGNKCEQELSDEFHRYSFLDAYNAVY